MKDSLPHNHGACHSFLQCVVAVADKYLLCPIGFIFIHLSLQFLSGEGNGSFT